MYQLPPFDIVMFSAESAPYVKVGGLGDVVGALPRILDKQGARVTVVIPAHKAIQHDEYNIRPYAPLAKFDVSLGHRRVTAEVYQTTIPGTRVELFLLGGGHYFYRDGIYDDPLTKEAYRDDIERYVFFCRAGIELLVRLGRTVDIIHCHDSQTGLIPALVRTRYAYHPLLMHTGVLFTIHNVAYQGIYPKESLYLAGLDERRYFYPGSPFEFWGKVNFMKVAIEHADLINTVSETYALEIQSSPEYGYGLEGILRRRKKDLTGIVNGIDYEIWNPGTDPFLPAHFCSPDQPGKPACKASVLKQFGLPQEHNRRVPLVGMVSRLAVQKGFDLIEEARTQLATLDMQMVVLGTGQQKYQDLLQGLAAQYPDRFAFGEGFNDPLGHRIYAGSDVLLMPSKYEPCGLNQLYALRYGTVPVVRATGGLVDTVTDYDPATDTGTGFRFAAYSGTEMIHALGRALEIYSDQSRWTALARRGMAQDWSWEESARKYLFLYGAIRQRRQGPK
jgi:starch synthase